MRNRNTQGFTLIELLIVIAIIGILAAVLIPNLLNARARANDAAAESVARQVVTAAAAMQVNNPANAPSTCTYGDPSTTVVSGSGTATEQSTLVPSPPPVTSVVCNLGAATATSITLPDATTQAVAVDEIAVAYTGGTQQFVILGLEQ